MAKAPKFTPNKHNPTIGDRLEISSDEVLKFLAIERSGSVTIREDLTVRVNKK